MKRMIKVLECIAFLMLMFGVGVYDSNFVAATILCVFGSLSLLTLTRLDGEYA